MHPPHVSYTRSPNVMPAIQGLQIQKELSSPLIKTSRFKPHWISFYYLFRQLLSQSINHHPLNVYFFLVYSWIWTAASQQHSGRQPTFSDTFCDLLFSHSHIFIFEKITFQAVVYPRECRNEFLVEFVVGGVFGGRRSFLPHSIHLSIGLIPWNFDLAWLCHSLFTWYFSFSTCSSAQLVILCIS